MTQEGVPEAGQEMPAAPPVVDLALLEPEMRLRALGILWRRACERDAPTLLQMLGEQSVKRVDVDADAGYVAVVVAGDTWRVLGFRADAVPWLVAALTGRAVEEVRRALSKGPAKFEPRAGDAGDAPDVE